MISDHKHSLCTRHGEGVSLSNSAIELFEWELHRQRKGCFLWQSIHVSTILAVYSSVISWAQYRKSLLCWRRL